MRLRSFISASEAPRPFSEVLAERSAADPRKRVLEDIADLEGRAREAAKAGDQVEAKRLQCEAEALRCDLDRR